MRAEAAAGAGSVYFLNFLQFAKIANVSCAADLWVIARYEAFRPRLRRRILYIERRRTDAVILRASDPADGKTNRNAHVHLGSTDRGNHETPKPAARVPIMTHTNPMRKRGVQPVTAGISGSARAGSNPGAMVRSEQQKSHQPTTATGGFHKRQRTRVHKCFDLTERVQDSAKNWEVRFPFRTSDRTP